MLSLKLTIIIAFTTFVVTDVVEDFTKFKLIYSGAICHSIGISVNTFYDKNMSKQTILLCSIKISYISIFDEV